MGTMAGAELSCLVPGLGPPDNTKSRMLVKEGAERIEDAGIVISDYDIKALGAGHITLQC